MALCVTPIQTDQLQGLFPTPSLLEGRNNSFPSQVRFRHSLKGVGSERTGRREECTQIGRFARQL